MRRALRGLLAALLIGILWFVSFSMPVRAKVADYRRMSAEVERLHQELVSDEVTHTARREHEMNLVNTVGYTRPTTDSEQVARMVEQLETACVLAGVGLLEIAPLEPERVEGPSTEDATGQSVSIGLLRHPLQIQVIGELEGAVSLIHWLRQTNPMMMVDRMVMTRDDDGLVRMSAVVSSWRPDLSTIPEGSA